MSVISIKDPIPDGAHTRTPIPVKIGEQVEAYAVFRNGKYEFDVDQEFSDRKALYEIGFEIANGKPVAVRISNGRDH